MDLQMNTIAAANVSNVAPQVSREESRPATPDVRTPVASAAENANKVIDIVELSGAPVDNVMGGQNSGGKREQQIELSNSKGVVIAYDPLAEESVIKFMDSKGNVVNQVPPEMYLKMKELLGGGTSEDKGSLLSEIA